MRRHPAARKLIIVIIYTIVLLVLIGSIVIGSSPRPASASTQCPFYAVAVKTYRDVAEPEAARCAPNGSAANIGLAGNSVLILDMGTENQITDGSGIDFFYYERYRTFSDGSRGIYMDKQRG